MNPLRKARLNLIMKIREEVVDFLDKEKVLRPGTIIDEEALDHILDQELPSSYDEIEAEMEEERKKQRALDGETPVLDRPGPNVGDRLRTAMGYTKDIDLISAMEGAIEYIERTKALAAYVNMMIDASKMIQNVVALLSSGSYQTLWAALQPVIELHKRSQQCKLNLSMEPSSGPSSSTALPTPPSSPES